jgi:hypothetical protein
VFRTINPEVFPEKYLIGMFAEVFIIFLVFSIDVHVKHMRCMDMVPALFRCRMMLSRLSKRFFFLKMLEFFKARRCLTPSHKARAGVLHDRVFLVHGSNQPLAFSSWPLKLL